jgi:NAD(P)-dependent dehydrogenase (short-subunit alcohol dehydrogenase family)
MSELRLDGSVAIVTGAGAGLGRSHATLLAERGAFVVVNDLHAETASETASEIETSGGTAIGIGADVSNTDGASRLVEETLRRFGHVDIVVNNAGQLSACDFGEMTSELFVRLLAVNLGSAFEVTRAAWPHLVAQGHGRVISTTSNSGLLGTAGSTGYAAAKAGLWGLTRSLALEGAPHGITVNAIAPIAYTAMSRTSRVAPGSWRSGEGDPWARRLDVARVSPAVVWLAHETCPLNGEVLSVAGGRVARFTMGLTHGIDEAALTPEDLQAFAAELRTEAPVEFHASSGAEGKALHRRLMSDGQAT